MMRRKSSPNPPNACGSYFFDLHSTFPPSTLCTVSSFSLQLSRLAPGLPPGSHSYTNLIDGKTYSVDFSKATYNWDRLVFAYGSYSSDGTNYNASNYADFYEEMEVSKLMFHCGVAVDMQYDYPKSGSGTDMEKAVDALRDYFSYDAGQGVYTNKPAENWVITPCAYSGDAVGLLAHMIERLLKAKCRLEEVRAVEASVLKKS